MFVLSSHLTLARHAHYFAANCQPYAMLRFQATISVGDSSGLTNKGQPACHPGLVEVIRSQGAPVHFPTSADLRIRVYRRAPQILLCFDQFL